jgi:hypothetical protein
MAVAILVAAALTSCGGEREPEPTRAGDLTAIGCPMVQAKGADGVARFQPAKSALNTATLVGRPLVKAREAASRHGCEIEVSKADGVNLPVPIDPDPQRIVVYVEREVVTYIEGVGGGL